MRKGHHRFEGQDPRGVDPLTGCASGSSFYAVLDDLYRRGVAGQEDLDEWVMVICDLGRASTAEAALAAEVAFSSALRKSITWASATAYLNAGRFVLLTESSRADATAQTALGAAQACAAGTYVTVCSLPASADEAWRRARAGRPRRTERGDFSV